MIQEMGLGIFLTSYTAKKIPYYSRLLENDIHYENTSLYYVNKRNYNTYTIPSNWTGCSLVIIGKEWDINQWDYNKLIHLPSWISYLHPSQDLDLEIYISETGKSLGKSIDIDFMEAMGLDTQNLRTIEDSN